MPSAPPPRFPWSRPTARRAARRPAPAVERLEGRDAPSVTPAGPEFRANTYTTNTQWNPAVGVDADGDFVIAWGDGTRYDVGLDGSLAGVYARRYTAGGTAQGPEFRVNSFTVGMQWGGEVALDADGDFVIAWQSEDQDGSALGVYAQRYNATADVVVVAPDAGPAQPVLVFGTASSDAGLYAFFPFGADFTAGVRVAAGDFTGDGFADLAVATGPGVEAELRLYDGASPCPEPALLGSAVLGGLFPGGFFVAVGDMTGDGVDDLVLAADAGQVPLVLAFDMTGGALLGAGLAYEASFTGGVRVALVDLTGDGLADLVTVPGEGMETHAKVFDPVSGAELMGALVSDAAFTGGAFVGG